MRMCCLSQKFICEGEVIMKHGELGNSGIKACTAPLGAMFFGTKQNRQQSFDLLDAYVDHGGDFIDTANIYAHWAGAEWKGGESETVLGEWFAARGNRDRLVIASKVGFPYADVPAGLAKKTIKTECEKSLRRMGIETIDLYFAHDDDPNIPQQEVLAAFAELIAEGKVRIIGASNFATHRLASANCLARSGGLPEYQVLQQRHTYLQPRQDADTGRQVVLTKDMAAYCADAGLSIMAYSATLSGAYSGDPARPVPPAYASIANTARLVTLREIAAETDHSALQVMLAWLWSRPDMMPLIAASTEAQLTENLAAMELSLDAGQIGRLDTAGD
jgi:aryl-alcohol dehydrogenase-like predicted oxidoreductase